MTAKLVELSRDHYDFFDLFFKLFEEKELLFWLSRGLNRPHMCVPSDQRRLYVEGFADCAAATQGSLGYEK